MKKALHFVDILTFSMINVSLLLISRCAEQCFLVFAGFRENKNRQSFVDERDKGTQVVCEGGLEWRQQEFIVL